MLSKISPVIVVALLAAVLGIIAESSLQARPATGARAPEDTAVCPCVDQRCLPMCQQQH